MNNLYLAVSIVFPLFCMVTLGYILKVTRIFDDDFLGKLNDLCFKVFLPLLLFVNIYQSDFFELFSLELVLFSVGLTVLAFLVLLLIVRKIDKDNKNRGVLVQGIFRSNYILFGIPISQGLYGHENIGVTAILIAFAVPLFNLLSVIALSIYSGKTQSKKSVVAEVFKNPLILASLIAFFFVLTGFKMPVLLESTLVDISLVATPLALITLGGSFRFKSIAHYKKQLFIGVLGKLVVFPGILVGISILFGYRNIELAALLAMFASPTAVSTFTMAQNAKANDALAGQIVVFSSILSILTIFIWIFVLKRFGLL